MPAGQRDLKAGDITIEDGTVLYSYRGKGGKRGRRELPRPAWEAIRRTLDDAGQELATMGPQESLWQAGAGPKGRRARRSTPASAATSWPPA